MTLRRPGGRWRLLVHEYAPDPGTGLKYGTSHDVEPRPGTDGSHRRHHELPGNCEFDELVVGSWCHIEQMDAGLYWVNMGGVTLWIRVDRDGRAKQVRVYGPGDYANPIDGCHYVVAWSEQGNVKE